MNDLSELIAPASLLLRVHAASKRQAIQILSESLAPLAGVEPAEIIESVLLRERLSGTGVGEGVAIPHARVRGLKQPLGAFARLEPPGVDFDALDGRPADLVFLLLAPQDRGAEHLKALARVSRLMRRPEVRARLREARSVESLAHVFRHPEAELSLA